MNMVDYFYFGGPFMVPLAICSIMALAIVAERFFYLRSAMKEVDLALIQIDDLTAKGDVDGIQSFCEANKGLLAGIFLAGIRKFKQLESEPDIDFVQKEVARFMEDGSIQNTSDLEVRLPLLSTIGNVAPLFGFAGTVTGMMGAFEEIAQTANPTAATVANGIREALITTATGLVIAIPVVLVYSYFTSKIDEMNARTEDTANRLIDALVVRHLKTRPGTEVKR